MAHEDLQRTHEVEGSSDRSFGLVFAAIFLVVAGWPLFYGEPPRWWALICAAILAAIALVRPVLLSWPNRQWTRFGVLLGHVVGMAAIGILYYAVVTPVGVALRLAGKDPMRRKIDRAAGSYWIPRQPPGPPPDSLDRQF